MTQAIATSTPEPLIAEIEKIMDSGEGGLSQSLVKLQPVGRLNAILERCSPNIRDDCAGNSQ